MIPRSTIAVLAGLGVLLAVSLGLLHYKKDTGSPGSDRRLFPGLQRGASGRVQVYRGTSLVLDLAKGPGDEGTGWRMRYPKHLPADAGAVNRLLGSAELAEFQAQLRGQTAKSIGINRGAYRLRVVGRTGVHEVVFGRADAAEKGVFVQVGERLGVVDRGIWDLITRPPEHYASRALRPVGARPLSWLAWVEHGQSVKVRRRAGRVWIAHPGASWRVLGDGHSLGRLLKAVTSWQAATISWEDGSPWKPEFVLRFGGTERHTGPAGSGGRIEVGGVCPGFPGLRRVRCVAGGTVYLRGCVEDWQARRLQLEMASHAWENRLLPLSMSAVEHLEFQCDGPTPWILKRVGSRWTVGKKGGTSGVASEGPTLRLFALLAALRLGPPTIGGPAASAPKAACKLTVSGNDVESFSIRLWPESDGRWSVLHGGTTVVRALAGADGRNVGKEILGALAMIRSAIPVISRSMSTDAIARVEIRVRGRLMLGLSKTLKGWAPDRGTLPRGVAGSIGSLLQRLKGLQGIEVPTERAVAKGLDWELRLISAEQDLAGGTERRVTTRLQFRDGCEGEVRRSKETIRFRMTAGLCRGWRGLLAPHRTAPNLPR